MKFILLNLCLLYFSCFGTLSQILDSTNVQIIIELKYDTLSIDLSNEKDFAFDNLVISKLNFYLSNFCFTDEANEVFCIPESNYLIDAEDESSLRIDLMIPSKLDYTNLQFNLGIDSLTSVSGVFGGDLDPTNGMYWTWNSGYINLKIEGFHPTCPTRKNKFQFHLGGYSAPFSALQIISVAGEKNEKTNLTFDLKRLFDEIDLAETNTIMSPSHNSQILSKKAVNSFYVDTKE